MRNLVIDEIINNYENGRADEFTRYLNWDVKELENFSNSFRYSYEGVRTGPPGDLYKFLIKLTDEDLLNILSAQHCQIYR